MIRSGLVALVLVLAAAAGGAAAQDVIGETVEKVPPVHVEMPANERCAADAVDMDRGAFGGGLGATIAAAEADALTECRQTGGKSCRIDSASCDPNMPLRARKKN